MSVKIILKGKIVEVCEVVEVGANNLKKQVVRILQPAYRDGFGDVKGEDEVWECSVLGDRIAKVGLTAANEGNNGTFTMFIKQRCGNGNYMRKGNQNERKSCGCRGRFYVKDCTNRYVF
jgi:hypothetical protein